jgi:hypothetical protein
MSTATPQLARIAAELTAEQRRHQQALFAELERTDSELTTRLISALGDPVLAMEWLARRRPGRADSSCDLLAKGRRDDVLDTLMRIEHGVYF